MNKFKVFEDEFDGIVHYIDGAASAGDTEDKWEELSDRIKNAWNLLMEAKEQGRYIPTCRIPVKERAYTRTRADFESLLRVADVDLAEATGIPEEAADHIVFMDGGNSLLDCRHVADALGITLDELFWGLYKLVDRSES